MESDKIGYVLIVVGAIIFLIAIMVFFSTKVSQATLQQSGLEECKSIQYNGEGRINLLFFADKDDAKRYTDFFLETKPFSEKKGAFNFFYIDRESYDAASQCGKYKGIAILCHSRELVKKAASCPDIDFIIVLKEERENIRSSAYLGVMSLNSNHLLTVFIHEFGHVFANFAEEYVPSALPRNQPNCKSECSDFEGEKDGCFAGCSDTTFYRSVEFGVMRTLTPTDKINPFGIFNSNIVNTLIEENTNEETAPITGQQVSEILSTCENEEYILFNVNTGERTLHTGCVGGTAGKGDFAYEIIDEDGNIILLDDFNANFFSDVQDTESETITGNSFSYDEIGETILTIPVIGGEEIIVRDEDDGIIIRSQINDAGARPCTK